MMRSIARQVCEHLVSGKQFYFFPLNSIWERFWQPFPVTRPLTVLSSLLCCCSANGSRQYVTEPDPQRYVPQQQPGPSGTSRASRQAGTSRRAGHRGKERFPRKSRFTRAAGRERYDPLDPKGSTVIIYTAAGLFKKHETITGC